jgi:hypothetical protein
LHTVDGDFAANRLCVRRDAHGTYYWSEDFGSGS